MSTETARNDEMLGPVLKFYPDLLGPGESETLAVHLLVEKYLKGAESKWAGYIETLPEDLGLPFSWTEVELKMLEGTQAYEGAVGDAEYVRSLYRTLFEEELFLDPASIFNSLVITEDRWVWAWSVVWAQGARLSNQELALIPLLDSMDVGVDPNVMWRWEGSDNRVDIMTVGSAKRGRVAAGELLRRTSGQAMSHEMLMDRGSLPLKNYANDGFVVQVPSLDEEEPVTNLRMSLLRAASLLEASPWTLHHGSFPAQMKVGLRIVAATKEELRYQHDELVNGDFISASNDRHGWELLLGVLQKALDGIPGPSLEEDRASVATEEQRQALGPKKLGATLLRIHERVLLNKSVRRTKALIELTKEAEAEGARLERKIQKKDKRVDESVNWDEVSAEPSAEKIAEYKAWARGMTMSTYEQLADIGDEFSKIKLEAMAKEDRETATPTVSSNSKTSKSSGGRRGRRPITDIA